jgi:hypothetical protein
MNASAAPIPVELDQSVAQPQRSAGRLRRLFATSAKIAYVVSAAAISLFFAAHAPSEGAPIADFLPSDAIWMAHVRDGGELLDFFDRAPGAENLKERILVLPFGRKKDAPEKTVGEARAELHLRLSVLPVSFRNELFRALSGEWAAVGLMESDLPSESRAQTAAKEKQAGDAKDRRLWFVRLRGGAGALLRLAIHFHASRETDSTRWFDLGGGLIAYGLGGAQPRTWSSFHRRTKSPTHQTPRPPSLPVVFDAASALVKIHLWPQARAWTDVAGLSSPTTLALIPARADEPETAEDDPPAGRQTRMNDGKKKSPAPVFLLRGVFGGRPTASASVEPLLFAPTADADAPIVVAHLPFNAQAAFEAHLASQHNQGGKSARRWQAGLEQLREEGVDLSVALWSKTAPALFLQISPPALEAESKFPVLQCSLPFLPQTPQASAALRAAAKTLIRSRWERFYEQRPPANAKKPCVRFFSLPAEDRHVILPGNFSCSLLTVGDGGAAFVSDAGFDGLLRAENHAAWPRIVPVNRQPRSNGCATEANFFLAYDGMRLTSVATALVEAHFAKLRKDRSAADFEKKYPNPDAWVTFASAAAAFSGRLHLALDDKSQISGFWQIGFQAP